MAHILVFGLGYVGTVSAACLAELGHRVIGFEPHPTKVDVINSGKSFMKEPGLDTLIKNNVYHQRLIAQSALILDTGTSNPYAQGADMSFICVGTPTQADGGQNLDFIKSVAQELGSWLKNQSQYHVVALRSTVFSGVTRQMLIRTLEQFSKKQAGLDFGVVCQPEFLREASAVDDFFNPPMSVIGALDDKSYNSVAALYQHMQSPIYKTTLEEAELIKVLCNTFHALKVGFANEVGRLCHSLNIDSQRIMHVFSKDDKLNISKAYLRPGFAFGGSCLPKDVRAINYQAMQRGVDLPIIKSILPSNHIQIEEAKKQIHQLKPRCVGVLGLSFKAHTDDLRESPMLHLIRQLWTEDINVRVFDPDVQLNRMLGSNQAYLKRQLPQIEQILSASLDPLIHHCDVLVVCQKRPEFIDAINHILKTHQEHTHIKAILDLVHIKENIQNKIPTSIIYQGLSW